MFFTAFSVTAMSLYNLTLTVANNCVRDEIYAQSALEVAIGVEQHMEFPTVRINEGLYLESVLRLVN